MLFRVPAYVAFEIAMLEIVAITPGKERYEELLVLTT